MRQPQALWSGRFEQGVADIAQAYTQNAGDDQCLVAHDILGSIAHVRMLAECGIVVETVAHRLLATLRALHADAVQGKIVIDPVHEDVHMHIEQILIAQLGPAIGGQVHTARSRNDQVMTTVRLFVREQIVAIAQHLDAVIDNLLGLAKGQEKTLMLGYTHAQAAQPISYAFWLTGHASALLRSQARLWQAWQHTNQSPLGAGALAGTSFPINRARVAEWLGFDAVMPHALDATSARDFMIDTAHANAMIMIDLSRLCEEIIWFSSQEFGVLTIADGFATGSSMMPQKKNPIVAEVMRARAAKTQAVWTELTTLLKGLSFGYNSDLQETKPALWQSLVTVQQSLAVMSPMLQTMQLNNARATQRCWDSFATATELANFLVREAQLPFRQAYAVVGQCVKKLQSTGQNFADTTALHALLQEQGVTVLLVALADAVDPRAALARQQSEGSTGPEAVCAMIDQLGQRQQQWRAQWQSCAALTQRAVTVLVG